MTVDASDSGPPVRRAASAGGRSGSRRSAATSRHSQRPVSGERPTGESSAEIPATGDRSGGGLNDGSSTSGSRFRVDPDVQKMLRVRGGDDGAFEELVAAYQSRVVSLLCNMTGRTDYAEDLAQEVFLRVYRSRLTYEPTARFSTWLFRITQNVAFNRRRTLSRRKEVNFRNDASSSKAITPAGIAEQSSLQPVRQAHSTEVQQVVREAVGRLNERQRMALLLHRFEGFSYADVAESMGLSVSAVKSLLSRARESLRQELEPYMRGESA